MKMLHNGSVNDSVNGSGIGVLEPWKHDVKPILDYLLLVILIVVMLAMGCEITWEGLWSHIRRPVGLCIGVLSQFAIKPLAAFCLLLISGIDGLYATGVLIISCCPGGVLSNTFTYFCEGDLSLSVAMTSVSTVIAMAMMPANLWLYGRTFESTNLVIPYREMALSLISVTSPVAVGMLIRWKAPRVAAVTTKIGSYLGLLIMFACIAFEVVLFPNMFTGVPAELFGVIMTLPLIGLSLGFGLAALCKRDIPVRKTISIECGVQNVPVALTIIAMSFPLELQADIVLLPWLYGFSMMLGCSVICLGYHCIFKKRLQRKQQKVHLTLKETTVPLQNDYSDAPNRATGEDFVQGTNSEVHLITSNEVDFAPVIKLTKNETNFIDI